VDDCVEFHGPADDLAPFYQASDVLLLTSDHEGTPNVILEAMASGIPVVATRVGGVEEVVEDGVTGLLADADQPGQLVESLRRLAADRALRREMGLRGRARVESRHSPQRVADALRALYSAVLNGPRPRTGATW
jgi:glycosyltransferase involved in cell wall biosynthesis